MDSGYDTARRIAPETISAAEARRIALAAQGFADRRPTAPSARHVRRLFGRVGLIQIDSVNVLVRSHYLPGFSRLGAYDPALLEDAAYGRRRHLFEYWGHEASLIPLDLQPSLRWRMERAARGEGIYGGLARFGRERADFIETVYEEFVQRGAMGAGELTECGKGEGGWWGWSDGKRAAEFLFWAGRITTATRRGFERVYDLTERVLPAEIVARPTPRVDEAQRTLLKVAAAALGVATERDLRDYFRLDVAETKLRLAELEEAGELIPVTVKGWERAAWMAAGARVPRRIRAQALLSPFDSLVWERDRAERLFGFRYRLEIYTPAENRVHGYYVLPFLLGDRLVARVDLKADRAAGLLRVMGAHPEAKADQGAVAAAIAEELRSMAGWLGLRDVAVHERGALSTRLAELF